MEEFESGQLPLGKGVKPAEGGVSSSVGEKEADETIAGRMGGEEEERVIPPGERIGGKGDAGIEGRKGSRIDCRREAVGDGFGARRPNFEEGEEEADRRVGFEDFASASTVDEVPATEEEGRRGAREAEELELREGRRSSIDLRAGKVRCESCSVQVVVAGRSADAGLTLRFDPPSDCDRNLEESFEVDLDLSLRETIERYSSFSPSFPS